MAYNYYQGGRGRGERIEDAARPAAPPARAAAVPAKEPSRREPGLTAALTQFLPSKLGELETEDIILLLVLYLMYRESGDSELLMIMGAMFLL